MTHPQHKEPEALWTADELAKFLGMSEATIQALASRDPSRIPPRVGSMRALRWVPSVCQDWAVNHSTKPKVGRPRML